MDEPYAEAEKIDQQIGKLIAKYPVSKFPNEWITVARTVKSGLMVIETIATTEALSKLRP